jgi:hypothetical protein
MLAAMTFGSRGAGADRRVGPRALAPRLRPSPRRAIGGPRNRGTVVLVLPSTPWPVVAGDSDAAGASRSAACWTRGQSVTGRESSDGTDGRGGTADATSLSQVMTAPTPAPGRRAVRDGRVQGSRSSRPGPECPAWALMVEFAVCQSCSPSPVNPPVPQGLWDAARVAGWPLG